MWKILAIPAPILHSTSVRRRKQFFLPLLYLGATASLCYLFLFAFVESNPSGQEHNQAISRQHSERLFAHSLHPVHNSSVNIFYAHRNKEKLEHNISSSSTSTLSSRTHPFVAVGRKTLFTLRRRTPISRSQDGTRRSHSSKVWPGHQDLGPSFASSLHQHDGVYRSGKATISKWSYYYPWKKDEQCKSYYVHLAEKNTFKPRALVSFPGSGNSWLRYLIENASGYFTGSIYNDNLLFNSGLLGEMRPPQDGTTIVQKTHHNAAGGNEKEIRRFVKLSGQLFGYRGILIIRNPYDALISWRHFLKTRAKDRHTGYAENSYFNGKEWTSFVTRNIPLWTSIIKSWIENSQDYLIVLYENVQKNPRKELIRILEYLDQPVDTTRLDCLMKKENSEGPFHRAHHPTIKTSSDDLLQLDSIRSGKTTSISQQDTKILSDHHQPREEKSTSSHYEHQPRNDELPLLPLDSTQSQQQPHSQKHLQSESPSKNTTTTTSIGRGKEQKEDKFLSLPQSFTTISSTTNFLQQQQNQYTSKMTSGSSSGKPAMNNNITTYSLTNDNHMDHSNNRLNKGSILRLDLIIQDNIDEINRFFQHKSIPVQLHYSPRPSTIHYFLQTYVPDATTTTTSISTPVLFP